MIELLAANAAVLGAASFLAAALPRRSALLTLMAVGLGYVAIVLVTMAIAGLGLRTLHAEALTGLSVAWLAIAGAVAWRSGVRPRGLGQRVGAAIGRVRPLAHDPAVVLAALLVLGTLAWRVFLALRLPIVDYDGWSYHLVFGDVWIQQDAIVAVPQRIWTAGYPANGEVLTAWLMAFTHSDVFAGFTSILPIPIAIVAVAGLARELGAALRWALLAGLVFGMTPALVAQAGTSYRDATAVAFPVATWWLGLRVLRGDRSWQTIGLLGLAGGIAAGTKGTNLTLTGPILAAAGIVVLLGLLQAWRARGRPGAAAAIGPWLGRLALLTVPVLALGAIWYLRNWLSFGNPLYPFAIGPWPGPTTLAAFVIQVPELERYSTIQQILVSWAWDWKLDRYAYNLRPGGIGRDWYPILLVAIVAAIVLLRRRRWAAVGLVIIPAVVTLLTMPMPWYARESLFFPALGTALAGVGASTAFDGHPTRRVVAHLGGLAIVGLAAVSLVFVNTRPNIDVPSPNGKHLASSRQYLSYLLSSDAERANVSLRAECAGFAQIPVGARVAPGGFNLLHGVVGPSLDRILTDPLPDVTDPAALAGAMRALGATWVVTSTGTGLDLIAASDPTRFQDRGDICQGGHLWQLAAGG